MKLLDRLVEYLSVMNIKMRRWRRVISVMSAIVVFVTTYALVLPAITLDVDTASIQSGIEVATENEAAAAGTVFESTPEEEPEAEPAEEEPEADPAEDAEAEEEESESAKPAGEEEEADAEEPASNEEEDSADEAETVSPENEDAQNGSDDSTSEEEKDETPSAETPSNEEAVPAATEAEGAETAKTVITEETPLITEKTQLTYKENDKDYVVYADFDESAKLPVGVELKVREITKEDDPDTYKIYYDKALEGLKDKYDENTGLSFARFYDIAFVFEGQEIEPKGNVAIKIEYKEAVEIKEETKVDAIHFDEKDVDKEEMKAEIIDSEKEVKEDEDTTKVESVGFESDKFSVYGVVGAETFTAQYLTEDGETYNISVTAGAEAHIPSDAKLEISEVKEGSDKYDELFAKAEAAVTDGKDASVPYARFFDIAIVNKDGEKIQPDAPVEVEITFDETVEAEKNAVFNAVHIADDDADAEVIDVTTDEDESEEAVAVKAVEFEAEGFSYYGVMYYTVDFEMVDGGTFSIPGSSSIALSDLLDAIGLDIMISDVENVEFSDPGLLEVAKVNEETVIGTVAGKSDDEEEADSYIVKPGDWLLTSVSPFDTDEKLTITLSNGMKYVINVTDAQVTTDLETLLTDAYIKINGQEVDDGSTITVQEGETFDLHLEFTENDFNQMDDRELTYALPEGITLGDRAFSKKIDVSLGRDGIVYNNTLSYDPQTNTLTFTWNRRDPRYRRLQSADNAKLIFDLTGQFTSDATHVEFENGYDVTVEQTQKKEANVTKAGQLYLPGADGNPFNGPAIKYTVTVTSTGQTTVNVKDTVEGSAVTLQTTKSNNNGADGGWTVTSSKGTQITPTFSNKGFSLNEQTLQDGEEVVITYWGKVDTSNIENLTNVTYQQTGNKVRVTGDDIPDKEATHYEHEVGANKLNKTATGVEEVDEDGKQIVHWKITLNNPPVESIGGTTLTDKIASASLPYMDYNTSGIHVVAKTAGGDVRINEDVMWEDSALTLTNESYDKHWVYNIPATNEALVYEITYDTVVDTATYNEQNPNNKGYFSVVNESEGKPGKDTGTATVGEPEGETPPDINYSKTAVDINEDTITWNIPINVKAGTYTEFKVRDTLPTMTYGSIGYTDDIQSITVSGLEGTEWYAISYEYNNKNDAYKATGNDTKPSDVILTFYKDGAVNGDVSNDNGQNSTVNAGLTASSDRIINIQIVTKNNQDWMELGREHYKEPTATDHKNTVRVNNFKTETYTAKPLKKSVMKLRDGNHTVSGPGNATAFKEVSTSDSNTYPHGEVINSDQFSYPAYKFWVLVGGITDSNLEYGNQIIITDSFNEHLRLMIDQGVEADKAPVAYGTSDTGSRGSALQFDETKGQTFTWSQSDGQATFTLTNPPKNGDNYYPYYLVEYWLVPKSEDDLAAIRALAMENDGIVQMENIATSDDISDELDFTYKYSIVDKNSILESDEPVLIKYTIEINKDMMTLNNGDIMELTDTYSSNLAIDFGTIEVTAEQKNENGGTTQEYIDPETNESKPITDLITWDFRKNEGTFTIPDATHVTITYYARPIGEAGSIQNVTNTAYMEGYYDTETKDYMVDMSGSGSAEIVAIRLLKFGADHMEEGLNGAVFRLLDQDKNPLKNFTTTESGFVNKYGVLHAGRDPIDYEADAEGNYVAQIQKYQLTEEAQARVNSGTLKLTIQESDFGEDESWEEFCARNQGNIVTYDDISDSALKTLGINKHGGFVEVMLDQLTDNMALKKERVYYLQEIVAPPGYEIDTTLYSFLITDQADYTAPAGVYVYHNNDVLTVRNWPEESPSLKLQKSFAGNAELTDEQKNAVTFQIQQKVDGEWTDYNVNVWRDGDKLETSTFTYGDYGVEEDTSTDPVTYSKGDLLFKEGVMVIENLPAGEYRVIESNQTMTEAGGGTYARKTEYLVDGSTVRENGELISHDSTTGDEIRTEDSENNGVSFTTDGTTSHFVSITNTYYTNKYTLNKTAADTAEVLCGAKFSIYSRTDSNTETLVKGDLETDENGKLEIKKSDNSWDRSLRFEEDTLYYVVESEAPAGFVLPDEPDKNYFYFSSENSDFNPSSLLPAGETAVDLSTGFGSALIPNKRDDQKTYFNVTKTWVNSMGQDITDKMTDAEAVTVTLNRTTAKPTAGKAITDVGTDGVEADLAGLHTLTLTNSADGKSSKVYFLQGDKLQMLVQGTDLKSENSVSNPTTNPYTALTKTLDRDTVINWTLTAPNNDLSVTVNSNKVSSLTVANITAANRSYVLTDAEANGLNGEAVTPDGTVTLKTSNNWKHTFSNLPLTDEDGNLYFYYVTEAENNASDTSISISDRNITVTNTAPEQLEVNKKWEDSDGNSVNAEKTDGSITYWLYQVENPLSVGPYTGDGSYSVNLNGFYRTGWNGNVNLDSAASGHVRGIKEGSKVKIEISTTQRSNAPLTGGITVTGGTASGTGIGDDAAEIIEGTSDTSSEWDKWAYRTRTIIVDDVTGNINLSGVIDSMAGDPTIIVTVLEEPTNSSTEWNNLVKNKMGEVVVTYDNATLTKADLFSDSSIRVSPGTKPWSSLIYNLDSKGTGTGANAGQRVNYSYFVEEKNSPVASNYDAATYQVNGNAVTNAIGNLGDTIVIINKENKPPVTDFTFYKVWHDVESQEVEWGDVTSITVTVGRKVNNAIDDDFSFTYEVPKIAFTETGTSVTEKNGKENAPTLYAILIPAEELPRYKFYMENLQKLDSDGEYLYFVKEEQVRGYQKPNYGSSQSNGEAYNNGEIINKPENAVTLPQTGGPGTKLFYGMGISFVAMAGLLLFIKRKSIRDFSEGRW